MKKLLLLSLLIVFTLSGCDKDRNEPAPGERPDERLSKLLSDYKSQLVSAPYGWKAILYPEGGAAYSFLFDFSENNRVSMLSDINASTASEALVSSYRLKAVQRPSLLFDTYSYIHILADPDRTKSGGEWGQGKYSDFEFSFDTVTPDSVVLIGNFNSSRLVLTRATQDESENYIDRLAESARAFEAVNNFTTYFKQLVVGNKGYDIDINTNLRTITFTYNEGNVVKTFTTGYYFTDQGVTLLEPFTGGGLTITTFNALQYDAARKRIELTVNNTDARIQEATRPAAVDPQAARRFHNNPTNGGGAYWLTIGFTVEGVEDAFKLSTLPDFSLLVYWPKYGTSSGSTYDLMGFVFGNSINYGPAAVPTFTNDGRIIFSLLGTLGTVPEQHAPIVNAFTKQWTDPNGYYVVQTGATSYDLVSAKDAKTWISFF